METREKSEIVKVFDLMSDYNWHSNKELNSLIGWNFKDKIFQLKWKGCTIIRQWSWKNFEWKAVFIPKTLWIVNWDLINRYWIQTTIVEKWEIKQKYIKNTVDEFIWNTCIKNPDYIKPNIWGKILKTIQWF